MKRIIMAWAFALCLFTSCEEDDYKVYELTSMKIDIADAKMLAMCEGNATKSSDSSLELFKIDKDGNMTAVRCWTSEDNKQQKAHIKLIPSIIVPVNDDYVVFAGVHLYDNDVRVYTNDDYNASYLIRKSDGAIFKMSEYLSQSYLRLDAQANAYYPVGTDIIKLALSNPNNLTSRKITVPQFPLAGYPRINPFEVDKNGNCIALVRQENNNEKMIYLANGSIYKLPEYLRVFNYLVGHNGYIYCCSYVGDKMYRIFPLHIGDEVKYDYANAVSKRTNSYYVAANENNLYSSTDKRKHFLISSSYGDCMLVFNSETNEIKEVDSPVGEVNKVVGMSANSIYRIVNDKIYKYNFNSEEKEVIPIDFDLNLCTVYRDWIAYNTNTVCKLILCVVRNSDTAILRIEVDPETGKAKVFEDSQDRPITTLVQIG